MGSGTAKPVMIDCSKIHDHVVQTENSAAFFLRAASKTGSLHYKAHTTLMAHSVTACHLSLALVLNFPNTDIGSGFLLL